MHRLMRIRDQEYLKLDAFEALRFAAWPSMTHEQLDALLATGAPS